MLITSKMSCSLIWIFFAMAYSLNGYNMHHSFAVFGLGLSYLQRSAFAAQPS